MLRPRTAEELRDEIIAHMKNHARYWASLDGERTTLERIEGALFSTLAMLDGCTPGLPAFDLVARSHPEDKQFCIDNEENWIEDGTTISTMLHEFWHDKPDQREQNE